MLTGPSVSVHSHDRVTRWCFTKFLQMSAKLFAIKGVYTRVTDGQLPGRTHTSKHTTMKTCFYTLGAMVLATSISFSEEKPAGPGGPDKGKHPKPEQMFAKLDADSNGSISLDEFKNSPRGQKNPAKAEEIFKKIDADSSGGITLEEFKAHKPAHGPGKGGKVKEKGEEEAPPAAE